MPAPKRPKIYHITHVDNLPAIIGAGKLVSDARMIVQGGPSKAIGMSNIKTRRLNEHQVTCHAGDYVGEYVPFYFCPRSIMLYQLHCANHPDLSYKGGQSPIVHLEADLHAVVDWATEKKRRWAFSLSSAATKYTEFRDDLDDLDQINWTAVNAHYWTAPDVKEGKQAEFLLYRSFPWKLVERIGVHTRATGNKATSAVAAAAHRPTVQIIPDWYY
jgi:hypothetical protein